MEWNFAKAKILVLRGFQPLEYNGIKITIQTLLDYGFLESITVRESDNLDFLCSDKLKTSIRMALKGFKRINVYFDSCPSSIIGGKLEQPYHTVLIPSPDRIGQLRLFGDTSYGSPYAIRDQINNLRDTWIAQEGVSSDLYYHERRNLKMVAETSLMQIYSFSELVIRPVPQISNC